MTKGLTRLEVAGSVRKGVAVLALLALAAVPAWAAPKRMDGHFLTDWCFTAAPGAPDTFRVQTCATGTDYNWYDAQLDNSAFNDINNMSFSTGKVCDQSGQATQDPEGVVCEVTADCTTNVNTNPQFPVDIPGGTCGNEVLFVVATLFNDPSPDSIPSAQVAFDIGPGGNTVWYDPASKLTTSPNIGLDSNTSLAADYLIVFDFSSFVLFGPGAENARLFEAYTTPGSWTQVPGPVLVAAIDPGIQGQGGIGGEPGAAELAVPYSRMNGHGGPAFGPGSAYRATYMVAQGDLSAPFFQPDGPIEDVATEIVAPGTHTLTRDTCPGSPKVCFGTATACLSPADCAPGVPCLGPSTECERADSSIDSYFSIGAPSGSISPSLRVARAGAGDVTVSWGTSCRISNTAYGVYEGALGAPFANHTPRSCNLAATSSTLTPAAGSSYFVVAPTNATTDGSHGLHSNGSKRSQGAGPCHFQSFSCP